MSHALGSVGHELSRGFKDVEGAADRAILGGIGRPLEQFWAHAASPEYLGRIPLIGSMAGALNKFVQDPSLKSAGNAYLQGGKAYLGAEGLSNLATAATASPAAASSVPVENVGLTDAGAAGASATPDLIGDGNLPALSPTTLNAASGFNTVSDLPSGMTTLAGAAGAPAAASSPSLLTTLSKYGVPAALAGYNVYQSRQQPQLPQQLQQVSGIASQDAQLAQQIIQSGGTASPMWGNQKQSIDAQINQNIQQARQQLLQTAANTGMGTSSMVVQQQIQQMTQQFEMQRQQLYEQAQQQNVSNATSLLSGSNASLTQIGETQLKQNDEARQQLAQGLALIGQLAGNL